LSIDATLERELTAPPAEVCPIEPGDRIQLVDSLRGFALFGVLMINIEAFNTGDLPLPSPAYGPLDTVASNALLVFGQGKFVTLFTLLFGASVALQLTRLQARTADPRALFIRRQLALLGIGVAHYVLVWEGDVLTRYALTGFLLLAFLGCHVGTLLKWSAGLLALELITFVGLVALSGGPAADRGLDPEIQAKLAVYHGTSYAAFVGMRIELIPLLIFRIVISAPLTLGLFLAGMAASQAGLFHQPERYRVFLSRACRVGLLLGMIGGTCAVVWQRSTNTLSAVALAGQYLNTWCLAAAYGCGIALLWLRPAWRRILALLAPVGRMALTNYLLQSVICTLLFDRYGLGWFGSVGPSAGIGLAAVIYTLQVPLSHWWLRHFRFGPAEWAWRSMTYGRLQPLHLARRA
jgi:uncharacterized protein